eukprot:4232222-Amphidinium_carterae.1
MGPQSERRRCEIEIRGKAIQERHRRGGKRCLRSDTAIRSDKIADRLGASERARDPNGRLQCSFHVHAGAGRCPHLCGSSTRSRSTQ